MQNRDFEAFRGTMIGLGKVYEREIDSLLLDAYWGTLRDWSLAEFQEVAAYLMASNVHMPRPAEFNAARRQARTSVEAWERARRHASSLYAPTGYMDRELGDRAIDAAVAGIGGYPAIAMCRTDALHFLERQFHERYIEVSDVLEARERLGHVAEHAERAERALPRGVSE